MPTRQRPTTSARARKLKSIKATSAPPVLPATPLHTAFIQLGRREAPSANVRVSPVSTRGRSATWRIDLDVGEPGTELSVVVPRAERRVLSAALRKRVRGRGKPTSFRPKWATQTFVPKLGPRISRTRVLRRGQDLEPLFVFPPDGRFVYKDTHYPWRCVGRVVSGGKNGSGVLIGPRHVLTASHVMNWSNLSVLFTANQFDSTNQGSSFATWDGEPYWSSIGYASDIGGTDRPVFQDEVVLEEEDGGDMMAMTSTTGDFVAMQSGSAVFSWWGGDPYAIGVVSAQGQGVNWVSGGEAMVDLVKTARNEDP